ncbi:hypothetical protein, partial [Enterococcus gallinarum]
IGNPSLNHRYRKGFYSLFKTLQQNRGTFLTSDYGIWILARQGKGFYIQIIEMGAEYKENFTNSTLLSLAFIVYLDESVFRR